MIATRSAAWPVQFCRITGLCCAATTMMLSCESTPLRAQDIYIVPVVNFINSNVRGWLSDPIIIETLKARNAANARLGMPEIEAMDIEWRNELNGPSHPLIDSVLATPLSSFLKKKEDEASGAITEVFVMDAKGLNVGQSGLTSDYWQGDEDKFLRSFKVGPAAMFVDVARKDESTQMLQSQVSITIVDEHNKPIGAITVGVNLDQL